MNQREPNPFDRQGHSDHTYYANTANEYQNMAFHPKNVILILVLIGITGLFLSLSAAFVYTRMQSDLPPIKLPPLFLFNTIILLGSSATMIWAKRMYKEDDTVKYQWALIATMLLSVLFMGFRSLPGAACLRRKSSSIRIIQLRIYM